MSKDRDKYWQQHEAQVAKAEQAKAKVSTDNEKIWKKAQRDCLIVCISCEDCMKRGYAGVAEHVVHITDPGSDALKFWHIRNWKVVCSSCFEMYKPLVVVPDPIPESLLQQLFTVKG